MPERFIKLAIVAGARPNFMKVAPLLKAAQVYKSGLGTVDAKFDCFLVHTGQHYDSRMSDIFFKELGMPAPDINLAVGSGTHTEQTAATMLRFEPVCLTRKPDWVVVVGDVNSTLACSLVAAKLGIAVAHVEAGLRSYDRTMPEELNRIVTDALSDLLLTPSRDGNENLVKEGVPECKIRLVGNIMIDALVANLEQARASTILQTCHVEDGRFVFVTLHRPANVDQPDSLRTILMQLTQLARQLPVVFPVHPRTRARLRSFGLEQSGITDLIILDPVGYHDSLCLTEHARLVLTDSGGLQEEATYFRTPCLTLRPNTERPVTIRQGSNRLTNLERLLTDAAELLNGTRRLGTVPDLWDGKTADRVLACLQEPR